MIAAPVAPIGWPRAIAPPLGLTFSSSRPRSSMTASACAANASLSSITPISSSERPARSSTLRDGRHRADAHDLRVDAAARVGEDPRAHGRAELLGLAPSLMQHDRGAGVVHARGVAGGDGAVLLEDRLAACAIDSGEASSRMCSSRVEVDRLALDPHSDRDDLVVEAARPRAPRRRGGATRRRTRPGRSREMPIALGEVLGGDAHEDRRGTGRSARPCTGSTIVVSPIRAPQRALGIQYGPRLIDSAPPASATSASPVWIACAAETIACTPVPHRRLTV